MKKLFALFLVIFITGLTCAAVAFPAGAAETTTAETTAADDGAALDLRVRAFDGADSEILPHKNENGSYDLFLPAGCDRSRLYAQSGDPSLTVDGVSLAGGKPTDAFAKDGPRTMKTAQGTYTLNVYASANLPALFIRTQSGSLSGIHADKNYKEGGEISLYENGAASIDAAKLAHIKGRGNSSWAYNEKRSYNIKLEKKTELLGMKPAKKWALVSNNMDASLLRNAVVYTAAKCTRLPYTVDCAYVDLFINGDYRGNYLLCEKVEVGENRIDITDLDDLNEEANPSIKPSEAPRKTGSFGQVDCLWYDLPASPADVAGGYLLEYDWSSDPGELAKLKTNSAFRTARQGNTLLLRSPEYATEEEIRYISGLYAQFEEALASANGKNSAGKRYTDYIDVDSFVDGLLIKECMDEDDVGQTSWFIFLSDKDGLFHLGPVWDFDQSMVDAQEMPDTVRFYGESQHEKATGTEPMQGKTFLQMLCSHRDFVTKVQARFFALQNRLFRELQNAAKTYAQQIDASATMDAARWGYDHALFTNAGLPEWFAERKQSLNRGFLQFGKNAKEARENLESKDGIRAPARPTPLILAALAVCCAVVLILVFVKKKKPAAVRKKKKSKPKKKSGKRKKK